MTTAGDLVRDLGIRRAGIDSPDLFDMPTSPDRWSDLITNMVATLDDADEFLEAYASDWKVLILVHAGHPDLERITAWAQVRDDVLLVAAYNGPRPPAVFVLEHP